MNNIPVIDMTATGQNIAKLRIDSGLSVKDLQDIFGFAKLNPRKNKYAGMLKQQIRKESQAKQKSMIL